MTMLVIYVMMFTHGLITNTIAPMYANKLVIVEKMDVIHVTLTQIDVIPAKKVMFTML